MSSVVISGDTSGAITLAAPAVSGTNTLTLPALTGTVTTNKTVGTVLQVVSSTSTTTVSTSSGTYIATGFSAAITPTFSTSKILVQFSVFNTVQTGNMAPSLTVYRDATSLNTLGFTQIYSTVTSVAGGSGIYLDSPATTSSTNYELYFRNQNANGTVTVNSSNGLVSIVLMEIAG